MPTDHTSTEAMRAYLLGRLSDDEASALEQEYFVNRSFLVRLQREETALIEDYLDGHLSMAEKRSFEKQYLEAPELREKLDEVRRRHSPLASVKPRNWTLRFAGAFLVILAVLTLLYYSRQTERSKSSAQTPANESPAVIRIPEAPAFAVYLSPGLTKGAESRVEQIPQPAPTAKVDVLLEIPGLSSSAKRAVQISIVKPDGSLTQVWSNPAIESSTFTGMTGVRFISKPVHPDGKTPVVQVLSISLSGSLFQPGDYVVKVRATGSRIPETYMYRVLPERKQGLSP